MSAPLRIGIIGLGVISRQYLESLTRLPGLELVAVADKLPDAAERVVAELEAQGRPGVAALTVGELLARNDISLVINLTIPAVHAEVCAAILTSGKHVYVEKPLALSVEEARPLLRLADSLGLEIGAAPDTILGTGLQTSRQLLDSGAIGTPVGATAFMVTPGHERWHPNPDFYYQTGGGPLFDMGPYYLTALHSLLGPVTRVSAMSSRPRSERTIGSGARAGQTVPVGIDTHVTALLQHASGAVSTMMMSFDVWAADLPRIEVYGTAGTLSVPDPNLFDGPVRLFESTTGEWQDVPPTGGYADAARGYGVADMAAGIAAGRPPRQRADVAFHVLEVMEAVAVAASTGRTVDIGSAPEVPAAVPARLVPGGD